MPLAGGRCSDGACRCRTRGGSEDAEPAPPAQGTKRFELRLSTEGGEASLTAPALGQLTAAGPREVCYYVDLVSGSDHDVAYVARARSAEEGIAPVLTIAEYGPAGPYWYDVLAVRCSGASGRCDRAAADKWARSARQRKRGRLDPCGSSVVTKLGWETSGGQSDRDGGRFRDLTVAFTWEIKKFPTQFKPGSTECVPK